MKYLALDVEYTNSSKRFSPYAVGEKLLTVAAFDGKKTYFWNINHPEAERTPLTSLFEILANPEITLIGHNLISDILWMNVYFSDNAIDYTPVKCKPFCTMIASDTLNLINREIGEKNNLETLTLKYTNAEPWKGKININNLESVFLKTVQEYNITDAVNTFYVWEYEQKCFSKAEYKKERKYFNWQMDLFNVLLKMMERGILVDKAELYRVADEIYTSMNKVEGLIYSMCKEEFNINSSKQLTDILYNKLNMPVLNVSKITGAPSADNDAIENILYTINNDSNGYSKHKDEWTQLLKELQEFRGLSKLWTTYILKMPKFLAYDGRIHAKTNLGKGIGADPKREYGARTGRLSYSDPNLQQVPATNLMRNIYIADEGYTLIDPDYKQLELVITAFLSQDQKMMEALELGRDMHTANLGYIEDIDYDLLIEILGNEKHKDHLFWKNKRKTIKPINFGILFGIGVFHCQQVLRDSGVEMSLSEIKNLMNRWFYTFPKVKELISSTQKEAREQGYVLTATGRKIMTPWARVLEGKCECIGKKICGNHVGTDENIQRNYRQGFNGKIQGLAVDVCLSAMLLIDRKIPDSLLIQVHDNLLSRSKDEELEHNVSLFKQTMTQDVKVFLKEYFDINFNVPLAVDIKTGKKWTT